MACIDLVFKVFCLSLLFIVGTTSRRTTGPKVFDVQRYGAKGDGKTDNTNVLTFSAFLLQNNLSQVVYPFSIEF